MVDAAYRPPPENVIVLRGGGSRARLQPSFTTTNCTGTPYYRVGATPDTYRFAVDVVMPTGHPLPSGLFKISEVEQPLPIASQFDQFGGCTTLNPNPRAARELVPLAAPSDLDAAPGWSLQFGPLP